MGQSRGADHSLFAIFFSLTFLGFNAEIIVAGSSPQNLTIVLLNFLPIWLGLALINKLIHKRTLQALYGPNYKINWQYFKTAMVFLLSIMFIIEAFFQTYVYATGTSVYTANMISTFGIWLLWLLPMFALLFIQIGAEQLFFRGYLLQTIRARGGNIFWAGCCPFCDVWTGAF